MTQYVGDHHLVLNGTVGFQQKAVGWVGVDYDFIDLREAEVVHRLHSMVSLAKRPVGIAPRQRIRSHLIHHRRGYNLKIRWIRIQAKTASHFPDLLDCVLQLFDFFVLHRSGTLVFGLWFLGLWSGVLLSSQTDLR